MTPKLKSIVDELCSYVPEENKSNVIEGRGIQVIASVQNLIELMEKSYPPEVSKDIKRSLLSAIETNNSAKFCRKMKKYKRIK